MRIISGKFKGRRLIRPDDKITRPTMDRTREAIFNILQHCPSFSFQGSVVLDVFAGSGAYGLESLSRGASHVYFIEKHPIVFKVLEENCRSLNCLDVVDTLRIDALKTGKSSRGMDLIFIDPPYHQNLIAPCLHHLDAMGWIKPTTLIVVETDKDESISFTEENFSVLLDRSYGRNHIFLIRKIGQE